LAGRQGEGKEGRTEEGNKRSVRGEQEEESQRGKPDPGPGGKREGKGGFGVTCASNKVMNDL